MVYRDLLGTDDLRQFPLARRAFRVIGVRHYSDPIRLFAGCLRGLPGMPPKTVDQFWSNCPRLTHLDWTSTDPFGRMSPAIRTQCLLGGSVLANHKSAFKRIRNSERKRLRNRLIVSRSRTDLKTARVEIAVGDLEAARTATVEAIRTLDKAASKGIIHL